MTPLSDRGSSAVHSSSGLTVDSGASSSSKHPPNPSVDEIISSSSPLPIETKLAAKQGILVSHNPILHSLGLSGGERQQLLHLCDGASQRDYVFRALHFEICDNLTIPLEYAKHLWVAGAFSKKERLDDFLSSISQFFFNAEQIFNPTITPEARNFLSISTDSLVKELSSLIQELESFKMQLPANFIQQKALKIAYDEAGAIAKRLNKIKTVFELYSKLIKDPNGLSTLRAPISNLLQTMPSYIDELKISSRYHPRVQKYLNYFYETTWAACVRDVKSDSSLIGLQLYKEGIYENPLEQADIIANYAAVYFKKVADTNTASSDNMLINYAECIELLRDRLMPAALGLILTAQRLKIITVSTGQNLLKAGLVFGEIFKGSTVFNINNMRFENLDLASFQALQTIICASDSDWPMPLAAFDFSMKEELTREISAADDILAETGLSYLVNRMAGEINIDSKLRETFEKIYSISQEGIHAEAVLSQNEEFLKSVKTYHEQQHQEWQQLGSLIHHHLNAIRDYIQLNPYDKEKLFQCLKLLEQTLQQWSLNMFVVAYFCGKIFESSSQKSLVKSLQEALEKAEFLQRSFIPESTWDLLNTQLHLPVETSTDGASSSQHAFSDEFSDRGSILETNSPQEEVEEDLSADTEDAPLPPEPTDESFQEEWALLKAKKMQQRDKKLKRKEKQIVLQPTHEQVAVHHDNEAAFAEMEKLLKKRGLKWHKLIRTLKELSNTGVRTNGSHHIVQFEGGSAVIPKRNEQRPGTQHSFVKQVRKAISKEANDS